ncbi:MAG: ABC transporter substrate-binding protein [Erysipelotrichaceae bacterium]|nr:ABC transporter substrate-binding protein [Erysipelotrichaceae bacterium]
MSKLVIELQKDIIENRLDTISILRKAKLIATKLNLNDFNQWIDCELNGYDKDDDIPDYRNVIGEIKAKNPYYGLIPVMVPSSITEQLNSRKLSNPISELISLSKSEQSIVIPLPNELSELLCANEGVHFPCYFIISKNAVMGVIESVKNHLLEWCLKLENDDILGEEYEFNEAEKEKAKLIPQQVNYYGPVVTGNVNSSQLTSGSNNSNNLIYNDINKMIDEIKKSIETEKISDKDKNEALEILEEIDNSIKSNKKTSIIKAALNGLKDFLINVGANITVAYITEKLNGF